ncbi:hypothetical protein D3C87_1738730 [compost metagenome]
MVNVPPVTVEVPVTVAPALLVKVPAVWLMEATVPLLVAVPALVTAPAVPVLVNVPADWLLTAPSVPAFVKVPPDTVEVPEIVLPAALVKVPDIWFSVVIVPPAPLEPVP